MLAEFLKDYNACDCTFKGIVLENVEEGEEQFQLDRQQCLDALILYLNARFVYDSLLTYVSCTALQSNA